ncbi:OmpA family protein [Aquamicrobium sp.]|uniref:OmpA family protein n=1 Tax=Aquamicrobium sp. TaxID=1872579 RepID=UPI00258F5A5E|nr:OmpA family protein [Aquamicrobium sp.]MCK9549235.1 OmpA family protein [Aquamicrobium sp.]
MKRVTVAMLATIVAFNFFTEAEASANLPVALDFFKIATPEANSPRIIDYDETWFITGPVSDATNNATQGDHWKLEEGKLIYAYYRFQPGVSALQIQREYEASLKEAGYEIGFSCVTDKGTCFLDTRPAPGVYLGLLLDAPRDMPALDEHSMSYVRNYFNTSSARYIYATKGRGENMTHIAVSLADSPAKGVMAITKSIMTGASAAITGASSLRNELKQNRTVSLDNLLFDVGSDILLPLSRDQLHEIAMMMREDPSMKLQIVGHTDSDGGHDYNLDLSQRRAASVVRALAEGFDIERDRLSSSGKGLSEPVASNDNESGKAKNRRVELRLQ